jgi:lipopolysaccharide transport system ATP-binding protein
MSHDINRWWHKVRGKEDPYLKIGEANDRSQVGNSDYVWALKDINFEVKPGEILGIIGKNGAGKSTLLKLLSRVTAPTTGKMTCHGSIASLLEVGTGFHPELTGRENVFLNGALLGMSKKEIASKLDEIVDFAGCARYMDTPVKRYSSGMRVRLGFAVAAFLEPDILVVDEVLAVGDAEFQKKAIGKMQDVSRGEGRTVLFVSHNMASIKSLCTRGLVLENGKTAFEGTADESVDYYLTHNSNENIRKAYINNSSKKIIKSIKVKEEMLISGKSLTLEILLKNKERFKSNIHIGIYNYNDEKLSHISSEYFNNGYLKDKNNYVCHIPKLTLTEGNYYINVGVVENNIVIERIPKCISFEVMNGDFYNCGINVRNSTLVTKMLIDYDWK